MSAETARRLDRLALRHGMPDGAQRQLAELIDVLARDESAPSGVREPSRALDVHLADALVALELASVRAARRIADLGAGAGFPGLPLAVALPQCDLRLVESRARRCAFLRRAVDAAGIENAAVVESRIEEWSEGTGVHDAVFARALAAQPVVLEYAAPLLRHGGVLVDWRGRRDAAGEQAALRAASELGLERIEVRQVHPFPDAQDRHLHVFAKVAQTPPRFPRRPGIARKRPLGG